jgi:hypothetical protein
MKRRRKRSRKVVTRPIAAVEFMGVALAVAPDEGHLDLVRIYPDGSTECLAELDQPGTSAEHCLSMMRDAVDTAYGIIKEQELLNRVRRNYIEPLRSPFDDPDPPYRPFDPFENN